MEKKSYVYMLLCADGTIYSGWTKDLEKRLKTHQSGKGAKYTRARLPVRLVYAEECATEHDARKRECELKKLSRRQKLTQIEIYHKNFEKI